MEKWKCHYDPLLLEKHYNMFSTQVVNCCPGLLLAKLFFLSPSFTQILMRQELTFDMNSLFMLSLSLLN